MDVVQDWAAHFLSTHPTQALLLASYTPYLSTLSSALLLTKSWLLHLIDTISHKPDLATLALLLVIVLVSLKIVDMLWQTLLFWVRLVRRLVFWGGAVGLALWLWTRGPVGVVEDVGFWVGAWRVEYAGWKEREIGARGGVGSGGRQQVVQQQQHGRWF
ncbi:hypothetical protein LTR91_024813 [Friedmanniomyces endolithicus]|uniref:Uncharacterized protein n=1 Tax=Friedmanniomyces endolithicus TaxID=329885 RepID=A0A4V5N9X0_9PEZI|nr:hypothetical protein LTS09_017602 [Friedmanniomyces endolithicus]KAK0266705.1 hypothetical protein LTR35_016865 [Friedmanniomyces endolithicus]KAK0273165.1 hypothetical protein LTS00_015919 [Friedmanniomyces endolithicus]KAK0303135.1 hypothetical protein LTR01_008281 [Friedmanniomyces endolithicus]KAK0307777.1 hypothetical protein LTR82_015814 [Friedmanniomyces endolithicus]